MWQEYLLATADELGDRFGQNRVFRDVEIRPGNNFTEFIKTAIASCNAVLVVICPQLLDHRKEKGAPRLHKPGDWVRLDVEAALAKSTWIVPVLVGGARMPPTSVLLDSIQRLPRIKAFGLTDRRLDLDIDQLTAMMASRIPGFDHPKNTEGTDRKNNPGQPTDSPEQAIRDVGMRVLE